VANQKGGVGKSTTAVSLGAALAELGHEVLVVDLDPQGNASTGLGVRHLVREITTYEVLLAEASVEDAIVETPLERLWAIPSTIDLAGAEIELVSQFSREMRLRRALDPARGRFDFVFLDCPPSLGLLTVNALAAADAPIVPIQFEYYAREGLGQLLRNVRLVQQNVNSRLRLSGIVLTMFDARTKLSEQVVAEVRRYFGPRVYDTVIPRTVRLSEAPGFGQPITVYDPASRGAQTYRSLAKEVANRAAEGALPALADLPSVIVPSPRTPEEIAEAQEPQALESDLDEQLDQDAANMASVPAIPPAEPILPAPHVHAQERTAEGETGRDSALHQGPGQRADVRETEPAAVVEPPGSAGVQVQDPASLVHEPTPSSPPDSARPPEPPARPESPERPVRVVHIGEIESRDMALPEPGIEEKSSAEGRGEEPRPEVAPRRRRKLFRKGGQR